MMKYSSYISFIWKNPVAQFLYRKTEKPILSIMDWSGKHVGVTVLILLLIGMGLRIGSRGMVDRPDRDEITYISIVEDFINVNSNTKQNLQPALIYVGSALHYLGFDIACGLRCFNLICSLLWLFIMYLLGKVIFASAKAGLACLLLATFNPYTIRIAGQIMREPLYLLLVSFCLFCAIQLIRHKKIFLHSILLSILSVLGLVSRYEGVELLVVMPLAVIFSGFYAFHSGHLKQKYIELISCLAIYLIVLLTLFTTLHITYPEFGDNIKDKFLQHYKNIALNNDNS